MVPLELSRFNAPSRGRPCPPASPGHATSCPTANLPPSWHPSASPVTGQGCNVPGEAADACNWPVSRLEDLQPDVLYHVLVCLRQQDVAHVKMCSSRLRSNILRACQHWAPKVESWLMSDPSSAGLLRQLRSAGAQPPDSATTQPPPTAASSSSSGSSTSTAKQPAESGRTFAAVAAAAAKLQPPLSHQAAGSQGELQLIPAVSSSRPLQATLHKSNSSTTSTNSSHMPSSLVLKASDGTDSRLDWRQVWSCLERAQQGPWQLDVRRLSPSAFPHGVLLTFELQLQQPAPPLEPGSREQQAAGWRDSVTVLSFVLDGKAVEIMVDASGRVTSPQKDWCQGSITLQVGQPKLLALEVSYIFPVPAWYLHPCTLAAPKAPGGRTSSSSASSCVSSSSSSFMAHDTAWDNSSLAPSSYNSSSVSAASDTSSMSRAHSAALCCALSSLSFTQADSAGSEGGAALTTASSAGSSGSSSGPASSPGGRPRLCLDLSHGLGSYVIDPRYIDEGGRNQRPRGLERLELAGRVTWRPNKVQTWLGRLLPGIRGHTYSHVVRGSSGSSGGGCSSSAGVAFASCTGSVGGGTGGTSISAAGSSGSGCSNTLGSGAAGSPAAGYGTVSAGNTSCTSSSSSKAGARPSFAVTVSKAAVWQVPADPEYRFSEGFMFWAVQHKAEQLLGHYGLLPPPWQGP